MMGIYLAAYNYHIQCKSRNDYTNRLFRLLVKIQKDHVVKEAAIFNIKQIEAIPTTAFQGIL